MNSKFLILLIALLHIIPCMLSAQDVILKKNGDEIAAKITEITLDEVKYKKSSNPSGPAYTIPMSELFMIKYETGDKDVFEKDAGTGKINVRHVAGEKPVQASVPTIVDAKKGTTPSKTASSGDSKVTSVKTDNTKGQQQTKTTTKKPNEVSQNNQPVKEKQIIQNDTITILKFKNNSVPIQVGRIGNGEDGKTFVDILGKFDIKTPATYTTFIDMFLALMKVKIVAGDKSFELKSFTGLNDGITFNFTAGGVNSLKFDGIQFTFDTSELPDSITVYNDEFTVTFDGKTKKVRK